LEKKKYNKASKGKHKNGLRDGEKNPGEKKEILVTGGVRRQNDAEKTLRGEDQVTVGGKQNSGMGGNKEKALRTGNDQKKSKHCIHDVV